MPHMAIDSTMHIQRICSMKEPTKTYEITYQCKDPVDRQRNRSSIKDHGLQVHNSGTHPSVYR